MWCCSSGSLQQRLWEITKGRQTEPRSLLSGYHSMWWKQYHPDTAIPAQRAAGHQIHEYCLTLMHKSRQRLLDTTKFLDRLLSHWGKGIKTAALHIPKAANLIFEANVSACVTG